MMQQWYEIRGYPLLAMVFLIVAWILLLKGKEAAFERVKILFAASLGVLGFSLMRFLIFWAFSDNILWAETWEEITECMFVLNLAALLSARKINRWLNSGN